jgi:hypothetical protein
VYFQFLHAVAALSSYSAVNLETENAKKTDNGLEIMVLK